jgi:DNA-binding transcriptional MerR regulator/effector-binding domain-containing protein
MTGVLTIGEFSRATHLSVKTLRHYHEVGLLEPHAVDPDTGYRYYNSAQLPTAQVIRRFRELGMPVDEVGAVLRASDTRVRNELIAAHLQRMEHRLDATRATVASLRALLQAPQAPIAIEHRAVAQTLALAISETVAYADLVGWWYEAFAELDQTLSDAGVQPAGPGGALYANELFERERGEVVVFVPVAQPPRARGRARELVIGAAELAVTVHAGAHEDIDRAYGALGRHVAEHALAVDGLLRESYLRGPRETRDETRWQTEIGWPVSPAEVGR